MLDIFLIIVPVSLTDGHRVRRNLRVNGRLGCRNINNNKFFIANQDSSSRNHIFNIVLWCHQYFSYIAVNFIGGGNRSSLRKTTDKSLTNFIT